MEMQIQIENLDKYYGKKHALDHVNLTISQGMFGLLGRNGAGENYFDENSGPHSRRNREAEWRYAASLWKTGQKSGR